MSVDFLVYVEDIASLTQIAIILVGLYRVIEMRRGFVNRTYKSRATWSALLMVTIGVTNAIGFVSFPDTLVGSLASFLPFLAIVVVSYAFIDRTVLVAMQSDFFHRDVFRWMRARIPSYFVLAASCVVIIVDTSIPPYGNSSAAPASIWVELGFYQFFAVAIILLGYGTASAIFGSRRTSDQTLKRHIRLLGSALGFFVLALFTFSVNSGAFTQVVGNLLTIFATFFVYLSVMSLTPLGKVEKVAAATQA